MSKTVAEKAHMNAVSELGCCLCRRLGYETYDVELHHIRDVGLGMGKRSSHYDVLPLCVHHHRGNDGFHGLGRKAFERKYGLTQADLLADVLNALDDGK